MAASIRCQGSHGSPGHGRRGGMTVGTHTERTDLQGTAGPTGLAGGAHTDLPDTADAASRTRGIDTDLPDTADAVVVGGGTVGAWCAHFLRQAGLNRVVLLEKGVLGQGASSRAAGVVRLQGGTPEAVRLGRLAP